MMMGTAVVSFFEGEYETALTSIEQLIAEGAAGAEVYYQRALCLTALTQWSAAQDQLASLVSVEESKPVGDQNKLLLVDCKVLQARCLVDTGHHVDACDLLTRVVTEHPTHAAALLSRGSLYLMREELSLAQSDFEQALATGDPLSLEWTVQFNLGLTYFKRAQYDKALNCFRTASTKTDSQVDAQRYQMLSHYYLGQLEEARVLADQLCATLQRSSCSLAESQTDFQRLMIRMALVKKSQSMAERVAVLQLLHEWYQESQQDHRRTIIKTHPTLVELLFFIVETHPGLVASCMTPATLEQAQQALQQWLAEFKVVNPLVFAEHNAQGQNVLHLACRTANLPLIEWLATQLAELTADLLLQRDGYQRFPMQYAIITHQSLVLWEVLDVVAKRELLPSVVQGEYQTYLKGLERRRFLFWCQSAELAHCAAEYVNAEVLIRLVAAGVDINAPDALQKCSPLAFLAGSQAKTPEQRQQLFIKLINTVAVDFVQPGVDLQQNSIFLKARDSGNEALAEFITEEQARRKRFVDAIILGFITELELPENEFTRSYLHEAWFNFIARWLHNTVQGDWQQVVFLQGEARKASQQSPGELLDNRLYSLGQYAAKNWKNKYAALAITRIKGHLKEPTNWRAKNRARHFDYGLQEVLFDLQVSSHEFKDLLAQQGSGQHNNAVMLRRYVLNYFIKNAYCLLMAIAKETVTPDVSQVGQAAQTVSMMLSGAADAKVGDSVAANLPIPGVASSAIAALPRSAAVGLNLAVYFYQEYTKASRIEEAKRFSRLFDKKRLEHIVAEVQQGVDHVSQVYHRQLAMIDPLELPALAEVMVKCTVEYITRSGGIEAKEEGLSGFVVSAFRDIGRYADNCLNGRQVARAPSVLKSLNTIFREALRQPSAIGKEVTLALSQPVAGETTWNARALFQQAGVCTPDGKVYYRRVTDAVEKESLGEYDRRYGYCDGDLQEVRARGLVDSGERGTPSVADAIPSEQVMLRGGLARFNAIEVTGYSPHQTSFIRAFVDYFFHGAYCSLMAIAYEENAVESQGFLFGVLNTVESSLTMVSGTTTLPGTDIHLANRMLGKVALKVFRSFLHYRERGRAQLFARVFGAWSVAEVIYTLQRAAELIAYKYADQINALQDVNLGVKRLAEVAVTRIVEHIMKNRANTAGGSEPWQDTIRRSFDNILRNRYVPPFQSVQKPLYELFINGLIDPSIDFGKEVDISGYNLALAPGTVVVDWTAAGVFLFSGVETPDGARYRREIVPGQAAYGFCRGDYREVALRGLVVCVREPLETVQVMPFPLALFFSAYPGKPSSAGTAMLQRPVAESPNHVRVPLPEGAVNGYAAVCLAYLLHIQAVQPALLDETIYLCLQWTDDSIECASVKTWLKQYDGTLLYWQVNQQLCDRINTGFRKGLVKHIEAQWMDRYASMATINKNQLGTYLGPHHVITALELTAAANWLQLRLRVDEAGTAKEYGDISSDVPTVELRLDPVIGYQLLLENRYLPEHRQVVHYRATDETGLAEYRSEVRDQVQPFPPLLHAPLTLRQTLATWTSIDPYLSLLRSHYAAFTVMPPFQSDKKNAKPIAAVYTRLSLVQIDIGRESEPCDIGKDNPLFPLDSQSPNVPQPHHGVIDGVAGSGKTTLSKYWAHEWAHQRQLTAFKAMLVLPLRDLLTACQQGITFGSEGALWRWAMSWPAQSVPIVDAWLTKERPTIQYWLDGFDEVEGATEPEFSQWLQYLLVKPNVMVTSRPRPLPALFKANRHARTLGYADEEIVEYVKRYVQHYSGLQDAVQIEEGTRALLTILDAQERLHEISKTPVMLAMICWLYLNKGLDALGAEYLTHTSLYDQLITQLVGRWQTLPILQNLPLAQQQQKIMLLQELAYQAITESEAQTLSGAMIKARLDKAPQSTAEQQQTIAVFLALGLLHGQAKRVEWQLNTFEFAHLSFQEFLAAKWWVNAFTSQDAAQVEWATQKLKAHKFHSRFEWVWRFAAGLCASAAEDPALQCNRYFDLWVAAPRMIAGDAERNLMLYCWDEINMNLANTGQLHAFAHEEPLERWLIEVVMRSLANGRFLNASGLPAASFYAYERLNTVIAATGLLRRRVAEILSVYCPKGMSETVGYLLRNTGWFPQDTLAYFLTHPEPAQRLQGLELLQHMVEFGDATVAGIIHCLQTTNDLEVFRVGAGLLKFIHNNTPHRAQLEPVVVLLDQWPGKAIDLQLLASIPVIKMRHHQEELLQESSLTSARVAAYSKAVQKRHDAGAAIPNIKYNSTFLVESGCNVSIEESVITIQFSADKSERYADLSVVFVLLDAAYYAEGALPYSFNYHDQLRQTWEALSKERSDGNAQAHTTWQQQLSFLQQVGVFLHAISAPTPLPMPVEPDLTWVDCTVAVTAVSKRLTEGRRQEGIFPGLVPLHNVHGRGSLVQQYQAKISQAGPVTEKPIPPATPLVPQVEPPSPPPTPIRYVYSDSALPPLVFTVESVPRDGNCGFVSLQITRDQWMNALLQHQEEPEYRAVLAAEILEEIGNRNEAGIAIMESWGFDGARIREFYKVRNANAPTYGTLRNELQTQCESRAVYQKYIQYVATPPNWLGHQGVLCYARATQLSVNIFIRGASDAGETQLNRRYVYDGASGRAVNMLWSAAGGGHYDRLIPTDVTSSPGEFPVETDRPDSPCTFLNNMHNGHLEQNSSALEVERVS